MTMEAARLQRWYATPQGRMVVRLVGSVMARWLRNNPSRITLGFGFSQPYLDRVGEWTGRTLGAAPAEMGVSPWPISGARNRIAQVRPDALPFPDAHFDRVIMTHLLEGSVAPRASLRETWRVLRSGGRLLVMVPNRGGLWARSDITPFGWGRPYSPGQIEGQLTDSLFILRQSRFALFLPPLKNSRFLGSAATWEKVGNRWFARLGGVILCEAEKRVYAGTPLSPVAAGLTQPRKLVLPVAEKRGIRSVNRERT